MESEARQVNILLYYLGEEANDILTSKKRKAKNLLVLLQNSMVSSRSGIM